MQKSRITKHIFILGLLSVVMLLLSACSSSQKSTSSDKVSIVASTNVYADIAKNVAGKYGNVQAVRRQGATGRRAGGPATAEADG